MTARTARTLFEDMRRLCPSCVWRDEEITCANCQACIEGSLSQLREAMPKEKPTHGWVQDGGDDGYPCECDECHEASIYNAAIQACKEVLR